MKWIRLFVFIVLTSIFIPSGIILAASPSVDNVKVFKGYQETGDWIIVATYNISGSNTSTSLCNDAATWSIKLIDNATGLEKANLPIQQCGMRPFGIYLSANSTLGLSFGGNNTYSVKIYGNWGTNPTASLNISTADWRGQNLDYLDKWVKEQAQIMETFDGIDYVTPVPAPDYEVLTVAGGNIFDIGIPQLSVVRPAIFQVNTVNFPLGYIPSNGSTSYADNLYNNWDVTLGPDVSDALTSAAPYFGFTSGRMVGALLTIMGFLSLAIIEKSVAFMIILGGVMIGVFPMATVVFLVFILAVVLIRSLFWSST